MRADTVLVSGIGSIGKPCGNARKSLIEVFPDCKWRSNSRISVNIRSFIILLILSFYILEWLVFPILLNDLRDSLNWSNNIMFLNSKNCNLCTPCQFLWTVDIFNGGLSDVGIQWSIGELLDKFRRKSGHGLVTTEISLLRF